MGLGGDRDTGTGSVKIKLLFDWLDPGVYICDCHWCQSGGWECVPTQAQCSVLWQSPLRLQGDGTILTPQERGWDQAWPGLVKFGDCCHPCHPCGAVLSCRWPSQPIWLSQHLCPLKEGRSRAPAEWMALGNREGSPHPFGSSQPCCHHRQVSSVLGLSPHRAPTQGGACCPPHGDTMSLPWAPGDTRMSLLWTPHRLLHRTCTKSVAGDRDAPSLESRWMWRYPGDRRGLSGWQGAVPIPAGQGGGTCTHLGACWAGAA